MNHRLKILKTNYERVKAGTKTFEIRDNGRFYQKGDTVTLLAFDDFLLKPWPVEEYPELEFTIGDVYPIDPQRVVFSLLAWTHCNDAVRMQTHTRKVSATKTSECSVYDSLMQTWEESDEHFRNRILGVR